MPAAALLALALACAPLHRAPRAVEVPLWRAGDGSSQLFVEVRLDGGPPRLFLLDTGASLTVIHEEVARELGLEVRDGPGRLVGLSGTVPWRTARVERVRIGRLEVGPLEVAVGVPGVPDRAGPVPVAGLLGNDVLARFRVEVDGPALSLRLVPPGAAPAEEIGDVLLFDGQHPRVLGTLELAAEGRRRRVPVLFEVDTGAPSVKLVGRWDPQLDAFATRGVEPVYGIGPVDELPAHSFLVETRRLRATSLEVGGTVVEGKLDVGWVPTPERGDWPSALGLPGLLGQEVLSRYRAVIDVPGERFALLPSEARRPPRRDLARHELRRLRRPPRDAEEAARLARLLVWADRPGAALRALRRWSSRHPDEAAPTRVLAARLLRARGEPEAALAELAPVPAGALVDEGEVVPAVDALLAAGRVDDALALARAGADARPEDPEARVALSDALRAAGDPAGARAALRESARLLGNPDAHLLRRARLALDEGDVDAALALLRRRLSLVPTDGVAAWFYAHVARAGLERDVLAEDVERALARLHPGDGPLDFFAAAMRLAGRPDDARRLARRGRERDCPAAPEGPSRDNCEAWYAAMEASDLEAARGRVERALAEDPDSPEYLDTLAVVLEGLGDLDAAARAAARAAALQPGDVYLAWQAERLARRAAGCPRR